MDVPVLTFDPPIADFIKFEGYICNYFTPAIAVKQVLCHKVEKQRILQSSINRTKSVWEFAFGSDLFTEVLYPLYLLPKWSSWISLLSFTADSST
ncbi:uncharacterized protein [Rutidosis leptorrhynchoides]|uniref:uncharacterized protein isoform X6 n=1 Tax=Rutidosis leptorrhynchoides TaxID=125765 RepID=UPI003A99A607